MLQMNLSTSWFVFFLQQMGMEVAADLVMAITDMVEDLEVSSLFLWWLLHFFFSHSETFLHSLTIFIKFILIAKVILFALRFTHSCWLVLNLYMADCMGSS